MRFEDLVKLLFSRKKNHTLTECMCNTPRAHAIASVLFAPEPVAAVLKPASDAYWLE